MENSLLRNVRNISRLALYTISIASITLMAIILFQVVMGAEDIADFTKERIQFYYMYMCLFSIFVFNVRLSVIDSSIIMSFCSRRKDYLAARYLVNAVIIAVLLVIKLFMDIYNGGYKEVNMVLTAAAIAALFGAVNILGIVINKFGMIGYIIFLLVCGFIGGFTSVILSEDGIGMISEFVGNGMAFLAVSIVFMAISIVAEARVLLNSDIKR